MSRVTGGVSDAVSREITALRAGRCVIHVIAYRLVQSGPIITGVEEVGPAIPFLRDDIRAAGPNRWGLAWQVGDTYVRIASRAERASATARRPYHLWGSRWVPPTPLTPEQTEIFARAREMRRWRLMSDDERRTARDTARPSRKGAKRRREVAMSRSPDYDEHVIAMTTERVGLRETLTYYYADGATLTYYYHGGTEYRDAAGRDLSLSRRAASMRAARRAFDAVRHRVRRVLDGGAP